MQVVCIPAYDAAWAPARFLAGVVDAASGGMLALAFVQRLQTTNHATQSTALGAAFPTNSHLKASSMALRSTLLTCSRLIASSAASKTWRQSESTLHKQAIVAGFCIIAGRSRVVRSVSSS